MRPRARQRGGGRDGFSRRHRHWTLFAYHTPNDVREVPVLSGRAFEPHDDGDAPSVAVVSVATAMVLFRTANAVGRFGFSQEERG